MPKIVTTASDVQKIFAVDAAAIAQRGQEALEQAERDVAGIVAIADDARTFENTVQQFDSINRYLASLLATLQTLEMVSPDESIRTAAHDTARSVEQCMIEKVNHNAVLYRAIKVYADTGFKTEDKLSVEQRYYLGELLKDFKRMGLDLPAEKQVHVQRLYKELAELAQQFDVAISTDNKTIEVTKAGLAGLEDEYVAQLPRSGDLYVLSVDYPTYDQVMQHGTVEATRKSMWLGMMNRAYPANTDRLKLVIAQRDELAKLLGYESYAHLNLDDSMAQTVDRVQKFLSEVHGRLNSKVEQEFAELRKNLPAGVTLVGGKLKPWDLTYTKSCYKKKHLAIDEREIAEYFPLDSTLAGLLALYEQFLSLKFTRITGQSFWHPDVQLVAVHKGDTLLGYLLLDLHPRPFKFTHACEIGIIKAEKTITGRLPAVAVVIANFPKATSDKPALLLRNDVITFFHEFGHALHELLGATEMSGFGGTSVRRDFVEMPSQMLEEWMWDAAILKQVSKHYKTGKPLDDALIARISKLKDFDVGDLTQRQIALASMSLDYFLPGANKDVVDILQRNYATLRPHVLVSPEDHFVASFGHLMGYGAGYYGYLWSKVYALDMFARINEHGLLNPEIGQRYIDSILSPGGSRNPYDSLREFLGREPSSDAFFKDLGV